MTLDKTDPVTEAGGGESDTYPRAGPRALLRLGFIGSLRWLLVIAFLVSGAQKLFRLEQFRLDMLQTGFFSTGELRFLPVLVPVFECSAACLLGLRWLELPALALLSFMSAAFTGFHVYLAMHGIALPCGCGGLAEFLGGANSHWLMAALCAVLFAATGIIMFTRQRHPGAVRQ